MEIRIDLNDKKRKDLAIAIGESLGLEPVYQKAPSYAYEIGGAVLSQDNTLSLPANMDIVEVRRLIFHLIEQGFVVNSLPDRLVIEMPLDGFDDIALDNLYKLVASKTALIQKALAVEDLPIEQTNQTLCFPWFAFDTPSEDVFAYTQFVSALCDMAKKQKRVVATEKSVENEKYAFRCFLLRLGFIGDEYANTRKVLLRNLTGNSSWKCDKTEHTAPISSKSHAPSSIALEESAEAIAKHLMRGLIQYLEAAF